MRDSRILSSFQDLSSTTGTLPLSQMPEHRQGVVLVFDNCQLGVVLRAVLFVEVVLGVCALFGTTGPILFSDIGDISVTYFGKKSNYVTYYYLVLSLRNGEKYPLFAPVRFFEGGTDKAIVAGWKQRLEAYIGPASG